MLPPVTRWDHTLNCSIQLWHVYMYIYKIIYWSDSFMFICFVIYILFIIYSLQCLTFGYFSFTALFWSDFWCALAIQTCFFFKPIKQVQLRERERERERNHQVDSTLTIGCGRISVSLVSPQEHVHWKVRHVETLTRGGQEKHQKIRQGRLKR